MGKLMDFLGGMKVLEKKESKFNGEITVIRSVAFGNYIRVGGLTQSGGIIKSIWNKTLGKISRMKQKVSNVLVLGLGGGSMLEKITKFWPTAKITAVDIDPVMVALGRKYLKLDKKSLNVEISDALKFVNKEAKSDKKYDLICIDLYKGNEYPKKFESERFLKLLKLITSNNGAIIFNRLYYGEKRSQAVKFLGLLEKTYPKVDVIYPEANVMFVCFTETT